MPLGAAHSSLWDTTEPPGWHMVGVQELGAASTHCAPGLCPRGWGAAASPSCRRLSPRDSPALKPCRGWQQHRCWKRWLLNSERDEKQPETHLTGDCRAKPAVLRLVSPELLHQSPAPRGASFSSSAACPSPWRLPAPLCPEVRLQQRWKNQPWSIKMLGCFLPEPG